jgi:hypothetical protein
MRVRLVTHKLKWMTQSMDRLRQFAKNTLAVQITPTGFDLLDNLR